MVHELEEPGALIDAFADFRELLVDLIEKHCCFFTGKGRKDTLSFCRLIGPTCDANEFFLICKSGQIPVEAGSVQIQRISQLVLELRDREGVLAFCVCNYLLFNRHLWSSQILLQRYNFRQKSQNLPII